MGDLPAERLEQKKDWTLTPRAFTRLLDWLDAGVPSEGQRFLEMRRRLVAYFDRKNCPAPDEMADDTMNRVARRLEEEGIIAAEEPARYCYIMARFVFLESLRGAKKDDAALREMRRRPVGDTANSSEAYENREYKETLLDCLEQCTDKLEPINREIIIRYYTTNERTRIESRRALAEELGITVNALAIRACRIRDRLEACVRQCAGTR
jgi:DNA-directed RNA polymerase specialized sigma24 family protein